MLPFLGRPASPRLTWALTPPSCLQAPGRAVQPAAAPRLPAQRRRRPSLRPPAAASDPSADVGVRQPSIPGDLAVPATPPTAHRSGAAGLGAASAALAAAQQQHQQPGQQQHQQQLEPADRSQNTAAPPAAAAPQQPWEDGGALQPAHAGTLWGLGIMTLGCKRAAACVPLPPIACLQPAAPHSSPTCCAPPPAPPAPRPPCRPAPIGHALHAALPAALYY